ncbi:PepSY domain-containing protein [Flavihumibacter sp. RY-1]|uniref:PepSY domain-containing protein n=1 Tax=Flavihumibacter fluminis TaxID=2909236 RepID=A0ABS9BE21_9BACT|nr:PepSY domain-containing protein [Flavihumibacter fluminis]MCF1713560.1 PepSY domain-containing protein [Flavihumibacter fluminis]
MTASIWRTSHLALAIVCSLFLLVAAVTGVVLAVDVIREKNQPYKAAGFEQIRLSESLPALKEKYPELLQLSIDAHGFVKAEGFDTAGNEINGYVHPKTGELLGAPLVQSDFVQWNLALHRSLFLQETGRFIVGVVSFLLMLIVLSGTLLIIQRQKGIRHFFDRMSRDFTAQYYHVVAGRLLLIPLLLLAASGTYLFLVRFELLTKETSPDTKIVELTETTIRSLAEFPVFQKTRLADVVKIEFPLDSDPEEYFKIQLKDRELTVHQFTGAVLQKKKYPLVQVWESISLDLHTGRTNSIWAIVIGIASLNILFFIYSGFRITLRRLGVKTQNRYQAEDAEFILLTGSENGSTLRFAQQVHLQLLANGIKSYLAEMNRYQAYPSARQLLVFTSTYGLGDAPNSARVFEKKLYQYPQLQEVEFSVVGFGSRTYKEFCGYAVQVDDWLEQQSWARRNLPLYKVNDKSTEDFVKWVKAWASKNRIALVESPVNYGGQPPGLQQLHIIEKTTATEQDLNFSVTLKIPRSATVRSGDLLAIYPAGDERERLYSIARIGKRMQLVVKLHTKGLGSQYLHNLKVGEKIKARIIPNPSFHLPEKAPEIALIANGTGIAPFLGMIAENKAGRPLHLYAGFRHRYSSVQDYKAICDTAIQKQQLKAASLAFSREEHPAYVMDLIRRDASFFASLLATKGSILICGSLAMQQDVEQVLDQICQEKNGKSLHYYKALGQVLADCY